jgi:hypothetical protein
LDRSGLASGATARSKPDRIKRLSRVRCACACGTSETEATGDERPAMRQRHRLGEDNDVEHDIVNAYGDSDGVYVRWLGP